MSLALDDSLTELNSPVSSDWQPGALLPRGVAMGVWRKIVE